MKQLNIGAGKYPLKGFVNIDIQPLEGIGKVCDTLKLPYEDNSIDEIFVGHVLNYLSFENAKVALREWLRVLKQDGKITIAIPDKELAPREVLIGRKDSNYYNEVHSLWDLDMLKKEAFDAGFENIKELNQSECSYLTTQISWQTGITASKRKPRILIGIPTWEGMDYILERFVENLKKFTYPYYDILFVDNSRGDDYFLKLKSKGFKVIKVPWTKFSRKRLTDSRNIIREEFLKGDYDYLFSLEQDLLPPKDIIENLLKHHKYVIGAPYKISQEKLACVFTGHFSNRHPITKEPVDWHSEVMSVVEWKGKVTKVHSCGLGCVLINRYTLEKIKKFRWIPGMLSHDDTFFYIECRQLKIPVYLDGKLDYIEHHQLHISEKFDKKNGGEF